MSLLSDSPVCLSLLCLYLLPFSLSSLNVPLRGVSVLPAFYLSEHPIFLQVQPLWGPQWRSLWPMQWQQWVAACTSLEDLGE